MKKRSVFITGILLVLCIGYFAGSGFVKNTSAYIEDCSVSGDGRSLTVTLGTASSAGFIRKVSAHGAGDRLCLDCRSAFGGVNGRIGARKTFTVPLKEDTAVVSLCRGAGEYEDVLLLDRAGYGGAVTWFDSLSGDGMLWDGTRTIQTAAFLGVRFRWSAEGVEAVTEKETVPLYYGTPVWSVFFCDLTGDGKPELCSSISVGYGLCDDRIVVCDYAGGAVYELQDRGAFDYTLHAVNGELIAEKRAYNGAELLASGVLTLRDGALVPAEGMER